MIKFVRFAFIMGCLLSVQPFLQAESFWENVKGVFTQKSSDNPYLMKILIVHDQPEVVVEVRGKYRIFDPHTNDYLSTRFIGKRRVVEAVSNGLKWGEEFPGLYQLKIVPAEADTVISVNDIEYKGMVTIYDIGGSISVINELTIDDFLNILLPARFSESMPQEALAAVAIVARTHAYYLVTHPKNRFWSVSGEAINYKGSAMHPSPVFSKVLQMTRGMVLSKTGVYEGEVSLFPARWSEGRGTSEAEFSKIPLSQVEEQAKQGQHAAQILEKAFPGTTIRLMEPNER